MSLVFRQHHAEQNPLTTIPISDQLKTGHIDLSSVPAAKTAAFIDIGTNSIRMLIVETNSRLPYRVLTQQKETVRLGEGEFTDDALKPEAINRAVLVCRKFNELARSYGAGEIIAVATSATREAVNQEEFLERMREEAGLGIQVVSGREEARLVYRGVLSGVNIGADNALFIDIGGGSTEIIIGNQQQYYYLDSLKLGAIRMTSGYLAEEKGPITPARYAFLQKQVKHSAIRTIQHVREYHTDLTFGSSGTIENLGEIACRMFKKRKMLRNEVISYEQLKAVVQLLCSQTLDERRKIPGINPDRADIIIGGAAIIDTLMQELELTKLTISDRGLRDGLLIDYLDRRESSHPGMGSTIRERSVLQLGRACNFDENHAVHVLELSWQLFDTGRQTGLHSCGELERELLGYAALLHDIGTFLSYNNHHAHTYYLIKNADLLGFNQAEINIMATAAYFHRKTIPRKKHPEFADLDKTGQKTVILTSLLLRIAESLDRSHAGIVQEARFVRHHTGGISLELITARDCQLELWGIQNHEKAMEEILEQKIDIRIRP